MRWRIWRLTVGLERLERNPERRRWQVSKIGGTVMIYSPRRYLMVTTRGMQKRAQARWKREHPLPL